MTNEPSSGQSRNTGQASSRSVPAVLLIVMDGYGCNDNPRANAVTAANTPVLDDLVSTCPHGMLGASGLAVGLPAGQMGNSEVGHLNLGAGKIVYQDFTRVSQAVSDGSFFRNSALLGACEHVGRNQSTLHVMGLIGFGGVHAHQDHLNAVIDLVRKQGVERLAVHAFTDGRDSPPHDGIKAVRALQETLSAAELGAIATVSGRYYAMDRDRRWDRTARAYFAMTRGQGQEETTAESALERSYAEGVGDEFVVPTVITTEGRPVALVQSGDAVIFFNFRTDRPRQLVRAFVQPDFDGFDRGPRLEDLYFATMTEYEKDLPVHVAFAGEDVEEPLARVISEAGLKQLHAAETEKYAHVTFFFNGGREQPFPGEDRILVPSPRQVGTYDKIPEMSADRIADQTIAAMSKTSYSFVLVNFANADMVGHTGDMKATIMAVETVDRNVGRLVEAMSERGGVTLITADHGNAEQMVDYETGEPFTSHTLSFPVPFVAVPGKETWMSECRVREGGILADVAPTVLGLLGLEPPEDMTGRSLLDCP